MTDFSILVVCVAAVCIAYIYSDNLTRIAIYRARSRNIVAQGWPPKHLDADGDPVGWDDETAETEEKQ